MAFTNDWNDNIPASTDQFGDGGTRIREMKVDINERSAYLSLCGKVSIWGTTTAPTGWLECDGSAVSRTTYADLFAIIGTTFGTGDGSTTFNLPDMSGEFVRQGSIGSQVGGRMKEHVHTISHGVASPFGLKNAGGWIFPPGASGKLKTWTSSVTSTYGSGDDVRPDHVRLMFIICYRPNWSDLDDSSPSFGDLCSSGDDEIRSIREGVYNNMLNHSPCGEMMFWSSSSIPTGWLECDGSAVSRSTYSGLFTCISGTHGYGDGSTTFNLPDADGYFVQGYDGSTAMGYNQSGVFPAHYHFPRYDTLGLALEPPYAYAKSGGGTILSAGEYNTNGSTVDNYSLGAASGLSGLYPKHINLSLIIRYNSPEGWET